MLRCVTIELRRRELLGFELHLALRVVQRLPRCEPLIRELRCARLFRLRLFERDVRSLDAGCCPLPRGLSGAEALAVFEFRACVERRRRRRRQPREQRARLHRRAGLELDAQQSAGNRSRHDVAVAHARPPILVDGLAERAAGHVRGLDFDRARREGPNQQSRGDYAGDYPGAPAQPGFVHRYSLVFSTPTRSSRSIRPRTISALAAPASTIASVANA